MHNRGGFTLIELSIVLVIIGLLVGGILVGRDLIQASRIRATISQYEQYNLATRTFSNKYNCLPGDCAVAASYGFSDGGSNRGDGNGYVGYHANGGVSPYTGYGGGTSALIEMRGYWKHLSEAKLIGNTFDELRTDDDAPEAGTESPVSKISGNGAWWLFSSVVTPASAWPNGYISGKHLLWLTSARTLDWSSAGAAALTPIDARAIDVKQDDGLPYTGNVRATDNAFDSGGGPSQAFVAGTAGSAKCANSDTTPASYNVNATSTGSDCANDAANCNRCGLVIGTTF